MAAPTLLSLHDGFPLTSRAFLEYTEAIAAAHDAIEKYTSEKEIAQSIRHQFVTAVRTHLQRKILLFS